MSNPKPVAPNLDQSWMYDVQDVLHPFRYFTLPMQLWHYPMLLQYPSYLYHLWVFLVCNLSSLGLPNSGRIQQRYAQNNPRMIHTAQCTNCTHLSSLNILQIIPSVTVIKQEDPLSTSQRRSCRLCHHRRYNVERCKHGVIDWYLEKTCEYGVRISSDYQWRSSHMSSWIVQSTYCWLWLNGSSHLRICIKIRQYATRKAPSRVCQNVRDHQIEHLWWWNDQGSEILVP
jgi:hypothetical protein